MQKPLFLLLFLLGNFALAQRPDFLKKDSIQSSLDGNVQVFYYDKSTASTPQPLVVELHSWSNTADSQKDMEALQAHAKNWNYIFPNFRGVNNQPKACCSEFVLADIDEAIDCPLAQGLCSGLPPFFVSWHWLPARFRLKMLPQQRSHLA